MRALSRATNLLFFTEFYAFGLGTSRYEWLDDPRGSRYYFVLSSRLLENPSNRELNNSEARLLMAPGTASHSYIAMSVPNWADDSVIKVGPLHMGPP